MTNIFGYGEDALTLRALATQLPALLQELDDGTDPAKSVVFYRPSFGRGGKRRAEFGEFDAIIGTTVAVYLLEAKWKATNKLTDAQERRHVVFRSYRDLWQKEKPSDWRAFTVVHNSDFYRKYGKQMAPEGSSLANNLQFVLQALKYCGHEVKDVLLYFDRGSLARNTATLWANAFKVVRLQGESSFFTIH